MFLVSIIIFYLLTCHGVPQKDDCIHHHCPEMVAAYRNGESCINQRVVSPMRHRVNKSMQLLHSDSYTFVS